MVHKKEKAIKTYEVGVKNRKPFIIEADRMAFGSYGSGDLKFHKDGELVFAVAPQKWDYVRLTSAGSGDNDLA